MAFSKTLGLAAAAMIALPGIASAATAPDYVKMAGASDLYEKKSSQLVMGSTKNAGIRRFANEMVTDHTKSTAMVKAAAMKAGMHPAPPMLDAKQQGMIRELASAKGTGRDKLYVQQQKAAHQEALSLHQEYSSSGDNAGLKAAAGKIVPVVQHHIEMLNAMPAM